MKNFHWIIAVWALLSLGLLVFRHNDEPGNLCVNKKVIDQKFNSLVDQLVNTHNLPGMTAAYHLTDDTEGSFAAGYADVESNKKMTVETKMLAASIGKTLVGLTTIYLKQNGKLSLQDNLRTHLGQKRWFNLIVDSDSIVLTHLLNHTSGVADYVHTDEFLAQFNSRAKEDADMFTTEELIGYGLEQVKQGGGVGQWAYSDTGYLIVGLIIESASGGDFFDLVDRVFIKPNNLRNTTPSNSRLIKNLASGYTPKNNPFGLPQKTNDAAGRLLWNPSFEWTGGGFASTSEDLARLGAKVFGGNALNEPYLDDLIYNATETGSPDLSYGLGVAIRKSDVFGKIYGHSGWIPGYVSSLRYYETAKVAVSFQVNSDIPFENSDLLQNIEETFARIFFSPCAN